MRRRLLLTSFAGLLPLIVAAGPLAAQADDTQGTAAQHQK